MIQMNFLSCLLSRRGAGLCEAYSACYNIIGPVLMGFGQAPPRWADQRRRTRWFALNPGGSVEFSHQWEDCDVEAGNELLDIILAKVLLVLCMVLPKRNFEAT